MKIIAWLSLVIVPMFCQVYGGDSFDERWNREEKAIQTFFKKVPQKNEVLNFMELAKELNGKILNIDFIYEAMKLNKVQATELNFAGIDTGPILNECQTLLENQNLKIQYINITGCFRMYFDHVLGRDHQPGWDPMLLEHLIFIPKDKYHEVVDSENYFQIEPIINLHKKYYEEKELVVKKALQQHEPLNETLIVESKGPRNQKLQPYLSGNIIRMIKMKTKAGERSEFVRQAIQDALENGLSSSPISYQGKSKSSQMSYRVDQETFDAVHQKAQDLYMSISKFTEQAIQQALLKKKEDSTRSHSSDD